MNEKENERKGRVLPDGGPPNSVSSYKTKNYSAQMDLTN